MTNIESFGKRKIVENFEKSYIQQWVYVDILDETPTGHVVPFLQDLVFLTAQEMSKHEKELLAEDAIERGDHLLFDLTENDFRDQVLTSQIEYPNWKKRITMCGVVDVVFEHVFTHEFFVKDYHHQLRFMPVKGVW